MDIDIVIKIIGILFILLGVVYLLKPDIMKRLMEFFKQGKRIYFAALVRFVLAVIFLLAARECDITWLIATLGILFLLSGLLIFIIGAERCKALISWWQGQSDLLLRVIALIVLAVGAVIIYSA